MTKIAITALNAEGNPYSFGEVVVRLVDAGSGGAIDGGVIVAPRPVRLDESGEGEVDLTPTADVDPAGTCYAFTVVGVAPTVVRYLTVPAPNIVGPSEVPYPWNDPDLQVVFAEPPTFVPAPSTGTVGEVLTLVDDGDGKRYELRPPTGATTDAELDVTASAPMLKSASAVATYETIAVYAGVDEGIKTDTARFIPYIATEAGDKQAGINKNLSGLVQYAIGNGDLARTQVLAATALAFARMGGLSYGSASPGRTFTSPDPYLLVGSDDEATHATNYYSMPPVAATFAAGVDAVFDAAPLDDFGIDGFLEAGTHGTIDFDLDRLEDAFRTQGGYVTLFGEFYRAGDPIVSGGEYGPGRIYGLEASPPIVVRWADRVKWRRTIQTDRGDGHGVVRLWLPTAGPADEVAHGESWRIAYERVDAGPLPVGISDEVDWYTGLGFGKFAVFSASWWEYGGGFSHRFHPDDEQLDGTLLDANGNVATPHGDAQVIQPTTPVATTDASALSTGTVPFARLPIGTTSTTVPAGNDSRFSDARTPTAHKTSHATGGSDALAPSDIGAVPTSRQIAGLDLTADRNAAALRTALGLWTPIANETLGSASGSRTYDITGYRFVRIIMAARSNRNGTIDTIRLRFNGDTSSNYSTNTGSFTTFISAFDISGENMNTDRSGYVVVQFAYMAGAWLTGTAMGTGPSSTATTAANSFSTGFAWKGATSAAPTSIEVYTAIGQFVAGSSFLVEGRP